MRRWLNKIGFGLAVGVPAGFGIARLRARKLPVLILTVLIQKEIVAGLTAGSVKGG